MNLSQLPKSPRHPLAIFLFLCLVGIAFLKCQPAPPSHQIQIFAASSLLEAFQDLKKAFQKRHPHTGIHLNFAGSQVLRIQIEHGAKADVFASANAKHLQILQQQGLLAHPQSIATNKLALIVPTNNPADIQSFKELTKARRLVLGNANVPIGHYTHKLLQKSAIQFGPSFETTVRTHIVSKENNARLVRSKVELGEADAAIVYHTDALASDRVRAITIPTMLQEPVNYAMGQITTSKRSAPARQWCLFVASKQGQEILKKRGFETIP